MPTTSSPSGTLFTLKAGRMLRASCDGDGAIDVVSGISGAGFDSFRVSSHERVIGPYGSDAVLRLRASLGTLVYSEQFQQAPVFANVLPDAPPRAAVTLGDMLLPNVTLPVRLATFGDSHADATTYPNQDMSALAHPAANNMEMYGYRMGHTFSLYSGGRIALVANCGIGGTRSTTMVARDDAAPAANRKAMTDAANLGAQVCLISLGTNDIFQQILASSTAGFVDGVLNALYANTIALMKRARNLGMFPVLRSLGGNSYGSVASGGGKTVADVAAMNVATIRAADYIKNVLFPSLGFGAYMDIRPSCVDPVTGYWLPGMDQDGVHESVLGAKAIAAVGVPIILEWAGIRTANNARPLAPAPGNSASKGNGFKTAMTIVAANKAEGMGSSGTGVAGTNTSTPSMVEIDGVPWQQFLVTPLTFDGVAKTLAPAGLATHTSSIVLGIGGATPNLPVTATDLIRVEFDYVIDDGNGGAPANMLSIGADMIIGDGTTTFTFNPITKSTTNTYLVRPDEPVAGKLVTPPIQVINASASITTNVLRLFTHASTTTPYRVLIGNVRILKVTP